MVHPPWLESMDGYPRREAPKRTLRDRSGNRVKHRQMATPTHTAADLIPEKRTISRLSEIAAGCRACPLWKPATQTVFGKGRPSAHLMLVGEQPGDREDR